MTVARYHDGRGGVRSCARTRACRAGPERSQRPIEITGRKQMSVSDRTRTLRLAAAASPVGFGAGAYADIAAGQSGGRARGLRHVDFHVATATRTAGNDANVRAALRLCHAPGGARRGSSPPAAAIGGAREDLRQSLFHRRARRVGLGDHHVGRDHRDRLAQQSRARRRPLSRAACASSGSIRCR